jgi:hypothetical protein
MTGDTPSSEVPSGPAPLPVPVADDVRVAAHLRVERLDDEYVVLDTPKGVVYRLSGPAAYVLGALHGDPVPATVLDLPPIEPEGVGGSGAAAGGTAAGTVAPEVEGAGAGAVEGASVAEVEEVDAGDPVSRVAGAVEALLDAGLLERT